MFTGPNQRRSARAFTLLEVVVGVTVLAFLAGTMFTIVQGSLQAAADIQVIQRDNRRLDRYVAVLRQMFRTLPSNATLELRLAERSPILQELVIRGAPEALVWGEEPIHLDATTISLRRYPEAMTTLDSPQFFLGLSRPSFFRPKESEKEMRAAPDAAPVSIPLGTGALDVMPDEKGRYWLPLLPSVRSMTWRFYQTDKKRWVEESGAIKPPLVELTLMPFERNVPIRVIFAIR
ncbi:MAG: type II secretory pathway pseudopilin PulG [Verrucomicrobiales bacterium]|jgi:type II secretory pathway pseudopilin PulG